MTAKTDVVLLERGLKLYYRNARPLDPGWAKTFLNLGFHDKTIIDYVVNFLSPFGCALFLCLG